MKKDGKWWGIHAAYLGIAFMAFLLSLCKFDHPVAIAAWIAPVFFMRAMRNSTWIVAVIAGLIVLQTAIMIGFFLPLIPMFEEATSIRMDASSTFTMLFKRGVLLAAPIFLLPFILDKACHAYLPKFAASLIYPSAVVAVESLTVVMNTFGDTQFTLSPLVMTTSIFGVFGLSFLVAWFAPMLNALWAEHWNLKNLGTSGLVYMATMATILMYGAVAITFPEKPQKTVPIAGITINSQFMEFEKEIYFDELLTLPSDEFAELMRSPQSDLDDVRQKTIAAMKAGAKIIVWQEMALLLESSSADPYIAEMQALADQEDVYLLASYFRLLNETERTTNHHLVKNISILFTPDGGIGWEYEKHILSPGLEEYMIAAGPKAMPYLDTPYGRIGQVICADMTDPNYIRQAAEKHIDLLFVPALDAMPYTPLFSFSSAYRAVENGFTMVRIAGNGYSAVIDLYFRQWAGQNSFVQGTENFYANVPVFARKTVYATIGFIFPYAVSILLTALIVLASVLRNVRTANGP